MKFGKLADISQVNFQLPPDQAGTITCLQKNPAKTEKLDFYIGCTGWSMKEWVGKVYPQNAKTKDFLRYYTKQFNTIELNTTHYRIPNLETIERWKAESETDFKFCPKIPQTISHSRNLGVGTPQLLQFCEAIQNLGKKLGCCFMQLPPYFGFNQLPTLEIFLKQFPNHIPLAIEVRHESWFQNPDHSKAFFACLEQYRASTVISDVAGRRDVLHMRLTTSTAMIRFVGNNLHKTDYSRVDDWVSRIDNWFSNGLSEIYFFTHEPDNIKAPELAQYLLGCLKEKPYIKARGPKFYDTGEGQQMRLF